MRGSVELHCFFLGSVGWPLPLTSAGGVHDGKTLTLVVTRRRRLEAMWLRGGLDTERTSIPGRRGDGLTTDDGRFPDLCENM